MKTITGLNNITHRILTFINNNIQPGAVEKQDHILTALYNMHRLFPGCVIVTCPVKHSHFFYISENCESIYGYDAAYMTRNFRMENYFTQIHETDMQDFIECMQFFESFLQNEPAEDAQKMRLIFHYRFRHATGKYIYILDEKATLLLADGEIVHYCLIRSMPEDVVFSGVKMEVYKEENNRLQKKLRYKPATKKNKLSGRETELVHLIKQGLTIKEIAGQLSISHHTVRNIKSRMFEKFSVNNMIELLNMTGVG